MISRKKALVCVLNEVNKTIIVGRFQCSIRVILRALTQQFERLECWYY
jgi:hypothetical protein